MNELSQYLTILLEPTSNCNIRCKHCYNSKMNYDVKKMSIELLEKLLSCCTPYYRKIEFIWHGGEPLLMGYDYFVKAYDLFKYYSIKFDVEFKFGIQTNGLLLDDYLLELFEKTNTKICISYDGLFTNILRPRSEEIEKIINNLIEKNVKFVCLSTITGRSVHHLIDLYENFKQLGISVKFNPIIPDGEAKKNLDLLITKEEWAEEFIKLFEYWFYDKNGSIELASCRNVLLKYLKLNKNDGCSNGKCIFRYLSVDANGNLYPCSRLKIKLHNINQISDIREAFLSENYLNLINLNNKRRDNCKVCKWFSRCNSGCNACARLDGCLDKPYEFDCYVVNRIFNRLEEILSNYNINEINKSAKEILVRYANMK